MKLIPTTVLALSGFTALGVLGLQAVDAEASSRTEAAAYGKRDQDVVELALVDDDTDDDTRDPQTRDTTRDTDTRDTTRDDQTRDPQTQDDTRDDETRDDETRD